jgi:hypothetical protein
MDDGRAAVAVLPAPTQCRLQRIYRLAGDLRQRHVAQRRTNVQAKERFVATHGRPVDLEHLEVAVEKLVDGRSGPRLLIFVDLADEPYTDPLGLLGCPRARRHRLSEVQTLAGERIDARARSAPLGSGSTSPRWRREARALAMVRV